MSKRIYLNDDWIFTETFTDSMLQNEIQTDLYQAVRLPHTCKETAFHYFDEHSYQMICGYRRALFISEEWKGKRLILTLEGVAHDSIVYINGREIAQHHCGYTACSVDISEYVDYGADNSVVVKVNSREDLNIPPFGFVIDYMTYGGIYRDVYLEVKNPISIADIFVKTKLLSIAEKKAEIISEISVSRSADELYVKQSLKNNQTEEYLPLGENKLNGERMQLTYPVSDISLWDVEHPELYQLRTELIIDGTVVDCVETRFGFRKAEFRKDGFYLNEKKLKLRGLNRHQSYPYVGYAMPESMQRMDADILKKELGLNAVRTSHYPQSHYFLDRCDELGLLVFTEIPGWQHIGDEAWKNQAIENVKDMILQYRNHTSIIIWGVRINESQDDDEFYERTNAAAHELDDSRPTGGVRAHKKSSLLEDVYTYNDFSHEGTARGCEPKSKVTSDMSKPYLISEYNGHMYPTKAFDWEEHRVEHALRHARVLNDVAGEEDIAGCFGWCMFDYNTHKDFGSGDRICYHGVMDMFRNPKLASIVYECQQEKYPVLELSSTMDIGEHPGCNRGETYIFTNADSVRMYKNDRFIKEYAREESPFTQLKHGPIVIDDFIGDALEAEDFKKGQREGIKKALNATARFGLSNLPKSIYLIAVKMMLVYHMKPTEAVKLYNKYIGDWGGTSTTYRFEAIEKTPENPNGKVVKTLVKQPMTEVHISAKADHYNLMEKHSYDVAAIRIQAKDENENLLNFYNDPVYFEVEGPIEIVGPQIAALQGGMGGTYIRTTGEAGKAAVTIHSGNAKPVRLEFTVLTS